MVASNHQIVEIFWQQSASSVRNHRDGVTKLTLTNRGGRWYAYALYEKFKKVGKLCLIDLPPCHEIKSFSLHWLQ